MFLVKHLLFLQKALFSVVLRTLFQIQLSLSDCELSFMDI